LDNRRNDIFWNVWILLVLDFFAAPHSWSPYVQIGLRSDLYIISLVFRVEKLFLISSDLSIRMQLFRVSRLVWSCFFHVSLLSRNSPKYFTVKDLGIITLLRVMLGHIPCLSVNVVCIDLFWFIFTCHLSYHSDKWLRCTCKFDEEIIGSLFIDKMTLSSA